MVLQQPQRDRPKLMIETARRANRRSFTDGPGAEPDTPELPASVALGQALAPEGCARGPWLKRPPAKMQRAGPAVDLENAWQSECLPSFAPRDETFDTSSEAMVVTTATAPFIVVNCNRAWLDLCNFPTKHDIVGQTLRAIQGKDTDAQAVAKICFARRQTTVSIYLSS